MSTPDSTSSLPPSKPRVLTPDEADRIADSIRPSWEAPPPTAHLAAPSVTAVMPATTAGAPAPAAARGDADRTLTNHELRALERSKRLRAVPENSYREERSPSAPPARVEKAGVEPSIIVDPRALAAPRVPSGVRGAGAAPTSPAGAMLSADSTVVIAPSSTASPRPQRMAVLVGLGAAAALVAGAIYFVSAQPTAPAPEAPAALKPSPAAAPAPPSPEPQAKTPPQTPLEPAVAPPEPHPVPSPAPQPEPSPRSASPKPEAAKPSDTPKKVRTAGAAPRHDPAAAQAAPPKQAPPPAVGGDKSKLVRDLPF